MARDNRIDKYADAKDEIEVKVSPEEQQKVEQAEKVLSGQISDPWQEKKKKVKMEESHMRTSFLFRRDLKARLDVLSNIEGRGYRTHFLNKAIEFALEAEEARLGIK